MKIDQRRFGSAGADPERTTSKRASSLPRLVSGERLIPERCDRIRHTRR